MLWCYLKEVEGGLSVGIPFQRLLHEPHNGWLCPVIVLQFLTTVVSTLKDTE